LLRKIDGGQRGRRAATDAFAVNAPETPHFFDISIVAEIFIDIVFHFDDR
jgi:hypothetical protein